MQAKSFKLFLKDFLLDDYSWNILTSISKQTDVYIFSGVIRNFLLGYFENRDLDIVVKNIENIKIDKKYFENVEIKKNNFGGYKFKTGQLSVDAWGIENTWGLQRLNLRESPYSLINTVFFNFSAIVYDFNKERFIFDDKFISFYKDKAMDVVYKDNPNKALCIINTIYYSKKYSFYIKKDLCKWIVDNSGSNYDYQNIQIKHFGEILYSNDYINKFIHSCVEALKLYKKNK